MTVTQKQIAERLGISRSLVGSVFQGQPRVSAVTRQRVLVAARQMGYSETSNIQARSLIAKRYGTRVATGVLAVVLPQRGHISQVATPFHSELLSGIEMAADEHDVDIYICARRPGRPLPRFIANQFVDAVICLDRPYEWEQPIMQSGLPVVSFFHGADYDPTFDAYRLQVDDREGVRQAVRHLSALGHRRIAYLGQSPTFTTSQERLAGYGEGLLECGIELDETLVEATVEMLSVPNNALADLRARASDWTALVCYNDLIAMDAIRSLAKDGVDVPRDISVVGFDDTSVQEDFHPSLTSVSFDRVAMGRSAVDLVRSLPDGELPQAGANYPGIARFPVELVARESTAPVIS